MESDDGTRSARGSPHDPDAANGVPSLAVIGRALLDVLQECTGQPVHLVPASRPVLGERRGVRVKLLHVAEDPALRNVVPRTSESRPDVAASSLVLTYAISVTASDEDLQRGALREHELLGRVIGGLRARPIKETSTPSGPASIRFLMHPVSFDDACRLPFATGEVTPPLIFVEARLEPVAK